MYCCSLVPHSAVHTRSQLNPGSKGTRSSCKRLHTITMAQNNGDLPIKDEAVLSLFTPHQVGQHQLSNRMVYAPLTRCRATQDNVPLPHMATYYAQRAVPDTLFIAEGTYINPESVGYGRAPGLWSDEQVEAWKPVTKAVKDKGAVFFNQLWHCGRASHPVPRELDTAGIQSTIQDYVRAARNALAAGFDGVEIHSANGYLLEEFIKSGTNKRTDEYGGSIENRCRLPLEVVSAVVDAIGADKVGIRLSPFSNFLGASDDTPYATYMYLVEQLNKFNLAYLHMVQPRIERFFAPEDDGKDFAALEAEADLPTLEPFRKVWKGTFIAASGYKAHNAAAAISSGQTDLVAFGRWWLANPDLPTRFKLGAPLNKYDRATFYSSGMEGYLDYPTLEQLKVSSTA